MCSLTFRAHRSKAGLEANRAPFVENQVSEMGLNLETCFETCCPMDPENAINRARQLTGFFSGSRDLFLGILILSRKNGSLSWRYVLRIAKKAVFLVCFELIYAHRDSSGFWYHFLYIRLDKSIDRV